MRILIDARSAYGGIQRYGLNLVSRLSRDLATDVMIAWGHDPSCHPGQVRQRSALRASIGDVRRVLTDQYLLPRAAGRCQADLVHSINHLVPRRLNRPCVMTCHDLWLIEHPEQKKKSWVTRYERHQLGRALGRADHLIAVSDTVAATLQSRYDVDERRLSVIYPPLLLSTEIDVRAGLPAVVRSPYLLTVGTLEPRKNLDRLIDAQLMAWHESRVPLLLAGPPGWGYEQIIQRAEASNGAVHWLGPVSEATLDALYRSAIAVVAFSLEEGFDYPTVEAMTRGTPLVLSDISVHREIVGDLGRYAAPNQPDALATQLISIVSMGATELEAYRAQAHGRVQKIAERGCSARYRDVYRRVLTG